MNELDKWLMGAPDEATMSQEIQKTEGHILFLQDKLFLMRAALRAKGATVNEPSHAPGPVPTAPDPEEKPPCYLDMATFNEGACPDGGESWNGKKCPFYKNCQAKSKRQAKAGE